MGRNSKAPRQPEWQSRANPATGGPSGAWRRLITPPSTEAAQTEANAGVITTRKESELQEAASDPNLVKKYFARTPNQKGVPEGQTRWYCHDCGKSFVATGDEAPDTCPQGQKPS